MEKNNVDKLLIKGLRKRYFRKATAQDISFGNIKPHKDKYDNSVSIEIPVNIGMAHTSFTIILKWSASAKKSQKWIDDNLQDVIEAKDKFNLTKDIKWLPKIVTPFVGVVNDRQSHWWNGIDKLCELFMKIQTRRLSNAMKFGLLTEEGFEYAVGLYEKCVELQKRYKSFYNNYLQNVQDIQILERWGVCNWDFKHALPGIARSLGYTISFLHKLIMTNRSYYGK